MYFWIVSQRTRKEVVYSMKLKKIRAQWEKNQSVLLCVMHIINKTVYVVVKGKDTLNDETYRTYRYFEIGDVWQVSIDYDGKNLAEALHEVTKPFLDILPE